MAERDAGHTKWRTGVMSFSIDVKAPLFWILVVSTTVLIAVYQLVAVLRPTIVFVAAAAAAGAAIHTARATIEHRRVSNTFRYMERWNAPEYSPLKTRWREIEREMRSGDMSSEQITAMLVEDLAKRTAVVDVFNFFEEMALAIKYGLVEEQILKEFCRGVVIRYYSVAEAWVKSHRAKLDRPKSFTEFEWLRDRWR